MRSDALSSPVQRLERCTWPASGSQDRALLPAQKMQNATMFNLEPKSLVGAILSRVGIKHMCKGKGHRSSQFKRHRHVSVSSYRKAIEPCVHQSLPVHSIYKALEHPNATKECRSPAPGYHHMKRIGSCIRPPALPMSLDAAMDGTRYSVSTIFRMHR